MDLTAICLTDVKNKICQGSTSVINNSTQFNLISLQGNTARFKGNETQAWMQLKWENEEKEEKNV